MLSRPSRDLARSSTSPSNFGVSCHPGPYYHRLQRSWTCTVKPACPRAGRGLPLHGRSDALPVVIMASARRRSGKPTRERCPVLGLSTASHPTDLCVCAGD